MQTNFRIFEFLEEENIVESYMRYYLRSLKRHRGQQLILFQIFHIFSWIHTTEGYDYWNNMY